MPPHNQAFAAGVQVTYYFQLLCRKGKRSLSAQLPRGTKPWNRCIMNLLSVRRFSSMRSAARRLALALTFGCLLGSQAFGQGEWRPSRGSEPEAARAQPYYMKALQA